MNDPTLGNWALGILASIIAGAITGLGFYSTLFRASKKRIYAEIAHEKEELDKRIAQVELQLTNRITLLSAERRLVEDKMGDDIHDMNAKLNEHGVQLGVIGTTLTHFKETMGRVETLIMTANTAKQSQFEELLAAIKERKR